MSEKQDYLNDTIEHIDINQHNVVPLVEAMRHMAYTARDLARAADIYDRMLRDHGLRRHPLPGRLARVSAGLKKVFADMIRQQHGRRHRLAPAPTSSTRTSSRPWASSHYIADDRLKAGMDDDELRELHIDRIYDTLIDEDELRVCDETIAADRRRPASRGRTPRASSSATMGEYLQTTGREMPADSHRARGLPRRTCRSSARRSATARPASAWSPTSTRAAGPAQGDASTASRIFSS